MSFWDIKNLFNQSNFRFSPSSELRIERDEEGNFWFVYHLPKAELTESEPVSFVIRIEGYDPQMQTESDLPQLFIPVTFSSNQKTYARLLMRADEFSGLKQDKGNIELSLKSLNLSIFPVEIPKKSV